MPYNIGSFNMRNLGLSSLSTENPRDLKTIARIIREENLDLVGLQEILSEGKAFTFERESKKDALLKELGGNKEWGFAWADAGNEDFMYSSNDPRGEGYAFIWNLNKFELCKSKDRYINGKIIEKDFLPRMLSVNRQYMYRKPFYGRFKIKGNNAEIRLICVHTYYGKDDSLSRTIRQSELDVLLKEIYPLMSDKRYGSPLESFTILLGDYNAELWTSSSKKWQENRRSGIKGKKPAIMATDLRGVVTAEKYDDREILTVQDELTTLKSAVDTDEFDGNGYFANYDHFSYEEKSFNGKVKVKYKRLTDAVSRYCAVCDNDIYQSDFEKYHKTISDHIPIVMEIEFIR